MLKLHGEVCTVRNFLDDRRFVKIQSEQNRAAQVDNLSEVQLGQAPPLFLLVCWMIVTRTLI